LFVGGLVGAHDVLVLEGEDQNKPDEDHYEDDVDQRHHSALHQPLAEAVLTITHVKHVVD